MTVAEAEERIEALTRNLASSEISPPQRDKWKSQMARCNRIIRRARIEAHRSLASFAQTLQAMTGDTGLDPNQYAALITAAHLIRCASTEQLAIAVPAAIRETRSTQRTRVKYQEFAEIAKFLFNMGHISLSCERHVAILTALNLSNIVGRHQVHQSIRHARAETGKLEAKGMVLLAKLFAPLGPQKLGPSATRGIH
jgi:hypothetical protein